MTVNFFPGLSFHAVVLFFPLILVISGSLKKECYAPSGGLFAVQRWSYGDVVLVFSLLTSTTFLDLLPLLRTISELVLWAIVFSTQAFVTLGTIYTILRFKYGLPLSALGFRRSDALYHTTWALKIISAILLVFLLVMFSLLAPAPSKLLTPPGPPIIGSTLASVLQQSLPYKFAAFVWFLDVAILAPMMEEVFFRAFVFTPFSRKFGALGAAVLSTMMWSSGHYYDPGKMIFTFSLGLFYAYLYFRTQSLFPSLVFHTVGNSVITLSTLLRSFQRAEVLILPAVVGSLILFLACRTLVQRVRPSNPENCLPWG